MDVPAAVPNLASGKDLAGVQSDTPARDAGVAQVLLVDDDEDSRIVLTLALRHASIDVIAASDGIEGLQRAREARPRVVVADIHMPGMSGFALVRALRDDASLGVLRIIALTAHATRQERDRFLEAGFDGVLFKPIEPRAVVRAVRDALQPWQAGA